MSCAGIVCRDNLSKAIAIKDVLGEVKIIKNNYISEVISWEILKNIKPTKLDEKGEKLYCFLQNIHLELLSLEEKVKSVCIANGKNFEERHLVSISEEQGNQYFDVDLRKIKAILNFTQDQNLTVLFDTSASDKERVSLSKLHTLVEKLYHLAVDRMANHLNCSIIDPHFKPLCKDPETGEYRIFELKKRVDCLTYVFYTTHEKRWEQWIFSNHNLWPFDSTAGDAVIRHLHELGYRIVDKAQKGGLICYLDKKYHFQHLGVMSDLPIVHSKWGILGPVIAHSMHCIPEIYKGYYLFLGKKHS